MRKWEKDIEEMINIKDNEGNKKYYKFDDLNISIKKEILDDIQKDDNRAQAICGCKERVLSLEHKTEKAIHGVYNNEGVLIISYWGN